MKKVMRALLISFASIMFVAFIIGIVVSPDSDYARITEVDYTARVQDTPESKGSVYITERITFDVHAEDKNNTFKELWRELPETYVDGVKVDYVVHAVYQVMPNGTRVKYEESPFLYWDDSDFVDTTGKAGPGKWFHSKGPYDDYYNYESLIFYVDMYRESAVFEIEYEMANAALRYKDASELYMSMYSGDSIENLISYKAKILIPTDKMPSSGNYEAYTYGTNAHKFSLVESTTPDGQFHQFSFALDASQLQFKPYNKYIEFALIAHGSDKHLFTQNAERNDYYNMDRLDAINAAQREYEMLPETSHNGKLTTLIVCSIGALLAIGFAVFLKQRMNKRYPRYTPTANYEYFREIPSTLDANLARNLVFCHKLSSNDTADGFSAAMLSLSLKGYLDVSLKDESKRLSQKNVLISLREPQHEETPENTLTPVELNYLTLIKRHAKMNTITLHELNANTESDYEYTNSFMNQVKQSITALGVNQGYYSQANYHIARYQMLGYATGYVVIALLVLLIGNIASYQTRLDLAYGGFFILGGGLILGALFLYITGRSYVLLTQFGEDEYAKWRGLYNFLNNETRLTERTIHDISLWEQYLVYATAFGISEKVIRALKLSIPKEQLATSMLLHNRIYYSSTFRSSARSFGHSARTATFTSRSGGHGGYGGGGRGGGGGGGGH